MASETCGLCNGAGLLYHQHPCESCMSKITNKQQLSKAFKWKTILEKRLETVKISLY